MGTSGAYGGSGGGWNPARRELHDLLTGGEGSLDDVAAPAAGALGWDEADGEVLADGDDAAQPGVPIPLVGTSVRPIRIRSRGGGGGVPGAGDGRGAGARRGRAHGGGTSRSRRSAARIGGNVAAAGYALRAGDAAALRRLGLDLAVLATLSPRRQAQRILQVLAGPAATIADGEMSRAAASMIIALLEADTAPTPAETVALFATEYVFEVMLTELGSEMRDGTRDGAATITPEQQLHDLIEARVASLRLDGDSVEAAALEAAIFDILEFTRRVMVERPNQ